jgi:hypothetical protein
VQVTEVPPRTAKLDAAPSDGADDAALADDAARFDILAARRVELSGPLVSVLHAEVSSANETSTPATSLGGASVRGRFVERLWRLCACMCASLRDRGFQSANLERNWRSLTRAAHSLVSNSRDSVFDLQGTAR